MPSRCSSLRGRSSPLILTDLPITETIDEVIVYHSNRLHVRINDRRADEAESPMLEILAECLGLRRSRWNLPRSPPVVQLGLPADKTPAVGVKIPFFRTSDQFKPACAPESTRTSKCLRSL